MTRDTRVKYDEYMREREREALVTSRNEIRGIAGQFAAWSVDETIIAASIPRRGSSGARSDAS